MDVSMLLKSPAARTSTPLTNRLADIGKKISQLADGIHRASRQLHPAILEELGLETALREECENLSTQLGIPVSFEVEKVPGSLADEVSLCLYRVAQESFRNIAKHAKAGPVRVRLTGVPAGVRLRIEDSGNGFDLEDARRKGGLGLISMEERVRLVHGKLTIHSEPGKGTTVEVFVPEHL
jgi:signal transduction histidine kinase